MPHQATLKQHQEIYRKILLRKRLLRWAVPGPAYVPFIGDGDLAEAAYPIRTVYGADLDPARVETASLRLASSDVRVADCDGWPFPDLRQKIAVADFDAYAYPYASFRAFWDEAPKASRLVLFFTDGEGQAMMRSGWWIKPDGSSAGQAGKTHLNRPDFYKYYTTHIMPWFEDYIGPWRVLDRFRYTYGMMFYWGAVIEDAASQVHRRAA